MCNMLDPDVVILSGSVAQCGPDWSDAMAEAFPRPGHCRPWPPRPSWAASSAATPPLVGAAENFVKSGYAEVSD